MKKLSINLNNNTTLNVWYLKGPKNAPVLHWAHANGLNAKTYTEFLTALSKQFHVYAWDARLHGTTNNVGYPIFGEVYSSYCNELTELINILAQKHGKKITLAGHSFGATLCLKSEPELRNQVSEIILADPVLFTPTYSVLSRFGRYIRLKKPSELYLAEIAFKRKNSWKSRAEIFESFSQKRVFKYWDEFTLKNYIKYGTKKKKGGFDLSCPPKLESAIFREGEIEFSYNTILNLRTKTFVYFAEKGSPSFGKGAFKYSKFVKSQVVIPRSSHFFPIEMQKQFAETILKRS